MPKTVVLRGDGGKVQIEVHSYERPESTDGSDSNWLVCKCGVTVREFSCDVNLSLVTEGFICFHRELAESVRSLKGTAVFATAEDGLKLEITFNSAGHADVFGIIQSQLSALPTRTKLDFSFETDQSFLSSTVDELRAVIQQFPVRGI
ncbi:MAG TPA: hypothetical protein VLL05_03335 [Terriglobales bacterium]|nr:hypothetical protein [Terriglobales bacterium]